MRKIPSFKKELFYDGDIPKDMVLIAKGEFIMGSNEYDESESPEHVVFLSDYWIDKYPVTNAQYKLFNPGHKSPPGFDAPDQPVVNVSWYEALMFAYWTEKRLPTEAEWEKAARGGRLIDGKENRRIYPWGNEWKDNCCNSGKDSMGKTSFVTVYSEGVSSYGCYDMVGNVWEWCMDWYDWGYYVKCHKKGVIINPAGPKEGRFKVLRGSSWNDHEKSCRCSFRNFAKPGIRLNNIGFRCVKPKGI